MNPTLFEAARSAYDYPLIISQLLHFPLTVAREQTISYVDGRSHSYADFHQRVHRLASALEGLGVRPGQKVAVMDWDSHRYLECFFAVPMMGAVLHTINVRLSPEQILYTIEHAEDDVLIVHADFLPLLETLLPRVSRPLTVVCARDGDGSVATALTTAGEYETLLAAADARFSFPPLDERTTAAQFYTTGTTGNPKGVHYTHRQIVLHTLMVATACASPESQGRFHQGDVYMPLTPMFHVLAWGIPYVATLLGVRQVYPGRYEPERILGLIERERVTFSHCVPTIMQMLLDSPRAGEVDLSRWKVVVGGSAMPRGLASAALEHGIDAFSGYGMSETGPVLTIAHLDREMQSRPAEEQLALRCATGRPLPLVELGIAGDDMQLEPHDGESLGEVVVRSPSTTQSYVKEPELSEALWAGGRLHSGDIGHIDERGFLRITDRVKDVIKSGGEWISSLELEDRVSRLEGVAEVAAIATPDEKWGERPVLLVVRVAGARVDAAAIREHLAQSVAAGELSRWAIPETIHFVESLAKTSVGKLDKKRLRIELEQRPAAGGGPADADPHANAAPRE